MAEPDVTSVTLSALTAVLAAAAAAVLGGASPASADSTPTPPLRVMPLGDSITMGIGSATMSSYRIDLQKRLQRAGLGVDFVGSQRHGSPATADLDHEGHSGWTIAHIAAQADGWLATYRPDAVLLQVGTNDMRTEEGSIGATSRLSDLIDQMTAAAPDTEIFVAKITGTKSTHAAEQQKRTDAYNAEVPGIVAGKGAHVHLVDQSGVRGIDIRDGLHPNDFGYAKMSWNWYRSLAGVYGGGAAWSTDDNPYAATHGNFCHLVDGTPGPAWTAYFDCRWYYRNLVATTAHGRTAKVWTWQTKGPVTETRKVWVKDHYETRRVTSSKWISFNPDRLTR
ncbi:SGNH/GDSL hydrolase family protein [Micromonosporaceae bacterium Da 78-11]